MDGRERPPPYNPHREEDKEEQEEQTRRLFKELRGLEIEQLGWDTTPVRKRLGCKKNGPVAPNKDEDDTGSGGSFLYPLRQVPYGE